MKSTFVRGLRSVGLLAIAGLMATTVVAQTGAREAGSSRPAATLQTRYASCNGLNFHPIQSWTEFGYTTSPTFYLYRDDLDSNGFFVCQPDLPQGAQVTKVQFTLRDASSVSAVRFCGLIRQGLTTASNTIESMADVPSTGVSDAPGIKRLNDGSIAHATVDNSAWSYLFQCAIQFTTVVDHSVGIIGASITYKISAANG